MPAQPFDGIARHGAVDVELGQDTAFSHHSGTFASATSTLALIIMARAEGKGALQPTNSTSHWLNGEQAAFCKGAGLAHMAVGDATHHAATLSWGGPVRTLDRVATPLAATTMMRDAAAVSVVAAAVDYGVAPKRFTPGWEFVLSKRSKAVAYGAMALGLAAGAMFTQHGQHNGGPTAWATRQ